MNYYERYCGDYASKTDDLTLQEHGAYTLMLDSYYSKEAPLPPGYDDLYRICRAMKGGEREAVRKVAERFFPVNPDGLRHNSKADEVIAKAQKRIAAAKANGTKHKPSGPPGGIPSGLPAGIPDSNPVGHIGTSTRPQTPRKSKDLSADADFAKFYEAYPRKEKRKDALKVFRKINPDSTLTETMLAALERHKRSPQWQKQDGEFIPLPASWLNGERWTDEIGGAPTVRVDA